MLRLLKAALTACLTLAGAAATLPGAAAEPLNLLIMGEDASLDAIRRNTPVFDRVLQAISAEVQARGFAVYDETAVTMEIYQIDRVRRSDAELISLARTVERAPIDAVTSFEIVASIEKSPYEGLEDLRLRITGHSLNINTGRALGTYEVSYRPGELPPLPLRCHRDCLLGFVGDHAAQIAADVGAELAAQLTRMTGGPGPAAPDSACDGAPNAYTLTFNGFTTEEMARIDGFLAAFQGYAHHRPLATDLSHSEYWYETCTGAARLEQNLRVMFDQTGAEVWLESNGQNISATKLPGTE